MFSFIYRWDRRVSIVILFTVIPIVMLMNWIAGVFIGGLLVVASSLGGILLKRYQMLIYFFLDLLVFAVFAITKSMNPRTIAIQGAVFVVSLIAGFIAGMEIGSFIAKLKVRKEQNCQLIEQLISAFVTAIDAKDQYLHNHSYNVSYYARRIAETMNLEAKEVEIVALAALLHDIGKLNVPEDILNKPARLSQSEWQVMKRHTTYGVTILKEAYLLSFIFSMIKYHHRHFDGSGYPNDCPNNLVPIEARIITVADSFDAMTSNRPYREALTLDAAYKELRTYAGSQFDPMVVEAFFRAQIKPEPRTECRIDLPLIFEDVDP